MHLIVHTDGGARGNPGPAGIGVHIADKSGREVEKRYKYLGVKTNNQAEYLGAFYGVRRAIELGADDIELRMDSQLVVEQLSGRYKIKNPELREIHREIATMVGEWGGTIRYVHIPRERNKEADRLSNKAMDEG
ncbi:MAG TPA: ribonuclease HI family protein [bacterium]|nr:ribonuclease HI family protein [bacterium]